MEKQKQKQKQKPIHQKKPKAKQTTQELYMKKLLKVRVCLCACVPAVGHI